MAGQSGRSQAARHRALLAVMLSSSLLLVACNGGTPGQDSVAAAAQLSPTAQLGKQLFMDSTLSVSGKMACGTCHIPSRAYAAGAADGSAYGPAAPVPVGGPDFDPATAGSGLPGFRNAPSLMYASFTPLFYVDPEDGPVGGFFRDGRAKSLADQAMQPLITPFEMGADGTLTGGADHDTAADVVSRLRNSPNLADFESVFGVDALDDPQAALADIGQAIAAYVQQAPEFHPFTSKFDYYQKGQVQLTAEELQGLGLFNNATKGNCSACHPSSTADGVTPPLFTDFTYDNIGMPRNTSMAVNNDSTTLSYVPTNSDDGIHKFYDLGLCGPFTREVDTALSDYCGMFKVPTLRDIALTAPYFHNGKFNTLQDVVGFYVRRDTNPDQWYPTVSDVTATKFDDLPAQYGGQFSININEPGSDANYSGNVNNVEVPYDLIMGKAPRLSPDEINAVVAFLCTLTDGYNPANPQSYPWPAQCQAAEPMPAPTPTP